MAKPRYIAPWHRERLEEVDLEAMSQESVELLNSLKGKPAIYQVSKMLGLGVPGFHQGAPVALRQGRQVQLLAASGCNLGEYFSSASFPTLALGNDFCRQLECGFELWHGVYPEGQVKECLAALDHAPAPQALVKLLPVSVHGACEFDVELEVVVARRGR